MVFFKKVFLIISLSLTLMPIKCEENLPKVSVIIPVYNREILVKRCLDSVLEQTYKNIEIICINDGSTDNSIKVLKKYAENDKRIILIDQKNSGVSIARNSGLNRASGEFIMFIDSDDYMHPKTIEIASNIQKKYDVDIVEFDTVLTRSSDKIFIPIGDGNATLLSGDKFIICNADVPVKSIVVWNKLYKKSVISNVKFNKNSDRFEDLLFNVMISRNVKKFAIIKNNLYYYYKTIDHKSLSNSFTMKDIYAADITINLISKDTNISKSIAAFAKRYILNHMLNANLKDKFFNICDILYKTYSREDITYEDLINNSESYISNLALVILPFYFYVTTGKFRQIIHCSEWRPQRDSNSRCRRERAMS